MRTIRQIVSDFFWSYKAN